MPLRAVSKAPLAAHDPIADGGLSVRGEDFRREVLDRITLREDGFGFEPEITAKVARLDGVRIYEVPISYYGRTYAEGKKIGWRDGIAAIWYILKYNFFSRER